MLLQIIEHYTEGNKAQFAKMLGVSAQTISAWIARNTFDAESIYTKCRYVNPHWLLTGTGPMLLDSSENPPSVGGVGGDKESLTFRQNGGNSDATASGAHSVAAINSTVNAPSPPPDASLRRENELLHDLLAEKERVIGEKERLIKVLMERK